MGAWNQFVEMSRTSYLTCKPGVCIDNDVISEKKYKSIENTPKHLLNKLIKYTPGKLKKFNWKEMHFIHVKY